MNLLQDTSRGKALISFAAAFLLATSMVAVFADRPSYAATPASAGVVVPLYDYPDFTWSTVAQTAAANPSVPIVAVINPSSGPGPSIDPNYLAGIQSLQASGVKVLGYVATGYATSSYSSIGGLESQIDQYKNWYSVNGIFFDEMANVPGYESYYSTLNSYVKSDGMTYTMGNPGASVPSSYIGILNNLVIYENSGYPALSYITFPGYPSSDFSLIAYGVNYDSTFVTSASGLVGYMYLDDLGGSNPYYTLSSYFSQTVAALANTVPPATTTTTMSSTSAISTTSTTSTTTSTPSTSPGGRLTITVQSANLQGGLITGMWTTVKSSLGRTVASGYSPLVFDAKAGARYSVCISSYQNYVFSNWSGGSTSPCETLTTSSSFTLTAYFNAGTSQLSVTSLDSKGNAIPGYSTVLYDQTRTTALATGYTPIAFSVNNGQSYQILVENFGSCTFAHWQDNGSTDNPRMVAVTSDTNLIAVYNC